MYYMRLSMHQGMHGCCRVCKLVLQLVLPAEQEVVALACCQRVELCVNKHVHAHKQAAASPLSCVVHAVSVLRSFQSSLHLEAVNIQQQQAVLPQNRTDCNALVNKQKHLTATH
jgi:hypothetical protein